MLGFIKKVGTTKWYPLPYLFTDVHISIHYIVEGKLTIISTQTNALDLRVAVIKGNPENGSRSSEGKSSNQIYDELKAAGVDINDYNSVVTYYNIKN